MKNIKDKLLFLWLPLMLISIAFVAIYSSFTWFIFTNPGFFFFKEDVYKFWLPFALPFIPVMIWLRPRIKALVFANDNTYFGYQIVAVLVIVFPTIVMQEYLSTATGKLTTLTTVDQFEKKELTKYYDLKQYYIDKTAIGIVNTVTASGKNNESLNLLVYITLPVRNTVTDASMAACSYYIGKKYSKQISNRLSDQEKKAAYDQFLKETLQEFDTTNFQQFAYLEKTANSDDLDEFKNAVKDGPVQSSPTPVIFTAHNEPFEQRNGGSLGWIFKAFGISALAWLGFLLFAELDPARMNVKKGGIGEENDFKEFISLLVPKKDFFVTPIIMDLNLLVYLLFVVTGMGLLNFKASDLLVWGGNYRPATTGGEWWRLLTCIFMHGGLIHLIANMGALVMAGVILEPLLGKWKFTVIYLVTGVVASLASIWWHEATVSVGASGAIFGLYGLLLALLLFKIFPPDFSKGFLITTLFFIGYNLVMGLMGGIDNAAHIGGPVSGFVIGLLITPSLKRKMILA